MAGIGPSPYSCHIFICVRSRQGRKKACADGDSPEIKSLLKKEVKERGWAGRVRVSECGCMGLCRQGPNVMLYPGKIWFSGVSRHDIPEILYQVEKELNKDED